MLRMIFWFAVLLAITFGVTWLADSPGKVSILVRGYRIETQSIGLVAFALAAAFVAIWVAWGIFKWLIGRPSALGNFFSNRREKKGRAALATGLIAIGSGDEHTAKKSALVAERMLPDDPLAQLLAAQSAQEQGDSARVKQVYQQMSMGDATKLLGLRGLFSEARRENNIEAARQIAKDALKENPGVTWASNAMLVSYAADKDWPAVLLLLENQRVAKVIDKATANTKKAVALTAQAIAAEDSDRQTAIELATKAHKLDPTLVPAAVVAGRANAANKAARKASNILEKTWGLNPHLDLAEVYAYAKPNANPQERLTRVQSLVKIKKGGNQGAQSLARAAIDAQNWQVARQALVEEIADKPTAGICTLMATIENQELGNKGRAREWLARAVHAPRDKTWTAGTYVSSQWLPVSPLSGELGAFEWKVPNDGRSLTQSEQEEAISQFLIADEAEIESTDDIVDVEDIIDISPDSTKDNDTKDATNKDHSAKDSDAKTFDNNNEKETDGKITKTETKTKSAPTTDVPAKANKSKVKSGQNHPPDDPGPKKSDDNKSSESWFG